MIQPESTITFSSIFIALIPELIVAILISIVTYKNWKKLCLYFKRLKLNLFPVKFNVALSIDFKEGLNSGNYFNEIKKNLKSTIEKNKLTSLIILNDCSDIKKFSSSSDAEEFIKKKELDLIIWGDFGGDGLKKDGEEIHKIDLKFTYRHVDDTQKRIGSMILADISSKMAIKNYWKILDNNSYNDIEIITNNIFDLVTYILGTTLKISGRINTSTNLFERLFDKLKLNNDDFYNQVAPHLLNCYELSIFDLLNKKNPDFNLGEMYCVKHLNIAPNSLFGLSNISFFQFKLGKEKETEANVEKLLNLYPNDPVTILDVAFIRIIQKKYGDVCRQYKKIATYKNVNFNTQDVVEFLDNQYRIRKDPALLYGIGIISFYFGDRVLAKETFKEYLLNTSDVNNKGMYKNAKRLSESF